MACILNIESSTTNCSVALGTEGICTDVRQVNDGYAHAEKLAPFVSELLRENKLRTEDLDAIAVSMGPGSYTGLRIGVALAKGLCYATGKPLIAVPTLEIMCLHPTVRAHQNTLLCPMLDARRMEVYTAVYNHALTTVEAISAKILTEDSFTERLTNNPVLFFGPGAEKFKAVTQHPNARFADGVLPGAREMCALSYARFQEKQFENVAYFEPFYLKDFMATTPKKPF